MTKRTPRCDRCQGDGYYWQVPNGVNPFLAGGFQTAALSEKIKCHACRGTGIAVPQASVHGESGAKEE